jgi:Uri superfamily endonuclease
MKKSIGLVLIDVGKRNLHLMDTVNAKQRWTIIYWRVNKFWKESHIVTRSAKVRVSFLKIKDINDISFFGTSDCHYCCSIA